MKSNSNGAIIKGFSDKKLKFTNKSTQFIDDFAPISNYYQRVVAGAKVLETNVKSPIFRVPMFSFEATKYLKAFKRNRKNSLENKVLNTINMSREETNRILSTDKRKKNTDRLQNYSKEIEI